MITLEDYIRLCGLTISAPVSIYSREGTQSVLRYSGQLGTLPVRELYNCIDTSVMFYNEFRECYEYVITVRVVGGKNNVH